MKRPTVNVSHITSGFVISHLLLALLGTLGRFTHLSFTAVKILFVIAGLILILKYLRLKTQEGINKLKEIPACSIAASCRCCSVYNCCKPCFKR